MNINQLVINRLANEIGTLKAQLIQANTFNEILNHRIEEFESQLPQEEEVEQGEGE